MLRGKHRFLITRTRGNSIRAFSTVRSRNTIGRSKTEATETLRRVYLRAGVRRLLKSDINPPGSF